MQRKEAEKRVFASFKNTLYVSKEVIKLAWEVSPKYTTYIIFILTFAAIIPLAQAYIIKKIIDNLALSSQTTVLFSAIMTYISFFIIITIISRFIENQRNSTQTILGNIFGKHIHHKIADKTSKLAFWRFEDPQFHDKLDRVRDQAVWKPLNTFYYLFESIQSIFTLISVLVVLYVLSPLLVLFMILLSLPSLFVQIKYGNAWYNLLFMETPESRRLNYYQYLLTNNRDIKDIKLYNLGAYFFDKYKILYNKLFQEQKKLVEKRYLNEFFTYLISDIVLIFFYFFIAWKTYTRELTIGDFTFYSTLYANGVGALHKLLRDISGIYENNLFINELLEFLNIEEEKSETKKKPIKVIKHGFTFKNVWFKYPGTDNWILKNVSFTLPPKRSIALVGENGAGKTTIVKLLTRLYEPTKGQILLDNVPIGEYDIDDYRNLFGITFQDFAYFYLSVEENIKVGDNKRKLAQKEITQAAKKVDIHKKIMALPKKYKTTLGRWYHEGHQISFGEWQRIAIARALIKDAPLYVLDEPTASLDAKAEYRVFRQFQKQVKGKMALFISHRFSNVRLADTILVIEDGRIMQEGTHFELMKKKGLYRNLYDFQARSYKDT